MIKSKVNHPWLNNENTGNRSRWAARKSKKMYQVVSWFEGLISNGVLMELVISSPTSLQYAGACYGIVPLLLLFPMQKQNGGSAFMESHVEKTQSKHCYPGPWNIMWNSMPFVWKLLDPETSLREWQAFSRKGKPNMTIAHGTSKTQQVFYFYGLLQRHAESFVSCFLQSKSISTK